MKMNCAMKAISFLALITLAASFPASQVDTPGQLATSAPRQSQFASPSPNAAPLPAEAETGSISSRSKRAIIFRPLFVYRQQQIQKQRLKEEREQKRRQQQATAAQPVPAGSKYAPSYYYNKENCNC